jgi:hypothetical protein
VSDDPKERRNLKTMRIGMLVSLGQKAVERHEDDVLDTTGRRLARNFGVERPARDRRARGER